MTKYAQTPRLVRGRSSPPSITTVIFTHKATTRKRLGEVWMKGEKRLSCSKGSRLSLWLQRDDTHEPEHRSQHGEARMHKPGTKRSQERNSKLEKLAQASPKCGPERREGRVGLRSGEETAEPAHQRSGCCLATLGSFLDRRRECEDVG